MSLSLTTCLAAHVPLVQAFFARVYRPDYALAVDSALFRWQFGKDRNGADAPYNLKLAIADGQVHGCLGYTPVEVMVDGEARRGAWLANWMVAPEHRSLGLGPLLMREIMRDFDIVLNLGPNAEARSLLARMGWTDAIELPRYISVLDRQGAAQLTGDGAVQWPDAVPLPAPPGPYRIQSARCFDDRASALWDAQRQGSLGGRRSAAYLNWRYADHPVFHHRILQSACGDSLAGFLVYRLEEVRGLPVRVARLLELVGASPDVESGLLQAAASEARACGAAIMDFFCPAASFSATLPRQGFLPAGEPGTSQFPILFQPIDRQRSAIYFMAYLKNAGLRMEDIDWYVTKADADQDRPN